VGAQLTVPSLLAGVGRACAGAAGIQGAVQFSAQRWTRWLGRAIDPTVSRFGADPVGLLSCLALVAPRLYRDDLRVLSAATDDGEGRLRLLVGVLDWGMGPSDARMMPGVVRLIDNPRRDVVLEQTATEAAAGRPAAAYRAWSLPGLGPPFFTKWLWACGCRAQTGTPAMIRDGRVLRSLRALGWDDRAAAGTAQQPEPGGGRTATRRTGSALQVGDPALRGRYHLRRGPRIRAVPSRRRPHVTVTCSRAGTSPRRRMAPRCRTGSRHRAPAG